MLEIIHSKTTSFVEGDTINIGKEIKLLITRIIKNDENKTCRTTLADCDIIINVTECSK